MHIIHNEWWLPRFSWQPLEQESILGVLLRYGHLLTAAAVPCCNRMWSSGLSTQMHR